MASTALALDRPPQRNGGGNYDWLKTLFGAAIIALATWFLTTTKADAVQENRLQTMEKNVDGKASKESVDAMQKQLDHMDQKLDRLLERRK